MKRLELLIILIIISIIAGCASSGKELSDKVPAGPSTGEEKKEIIDTGRIEKMPAADEKTSSGKSASAGMAEPPSGLPERIFAEAEAADGAVSAIAPPSARGGSGAPSRSGLTAGYSDDNRQYGYFVNFLNEYRDMVTPLDLNVEDRIMISLKDSAGLPVQGAVVRASASGYSTVGITLADGTFQINPADLFRGNRSARKISLEIDGGSGLPGFTKRMELSRNGLRTVEIAAQQPRVLPARIPLDIVFVMDTTGSMGEEISRLKNTINIIHMNLTEMSVAADLRFGMVLYKDEDDEYVTNVIPLTSDIIAFRTALDQVYASGGGDTPEDLVAALGELVNTIQWNREAVKLAYVITDAPPHLDYLTDYSCEEAVRDAREKGIKIFSIGTGGLDLQGEYVLRQIAQYTSARYIFLTYGDETGESAGGAQGSVSHHTGSNWSSDKLESIIIRFTREELSYLTDTPDYEEDGWFEADKIDAEQASETLDKLFTQAVEQLVDYSTMKFSEDNLFAVLPFSADDADSAAAEYFYEHLLLSVSKNADLNLTERKDISQILEELKLQNTGVTDEASVSRLGELLNADTLIIGSLFSGPDSYELFLRMVRVETAEVLSVARAVIDKSLGI